MDEEFLTKREHKTPPTQSTLTQSQIFIGKLGDKTNTAIIPVKTDVEQIQFEGRNPLVPSPHFLMCIIAPVKSGKSVLVTNLAFRDAYYKGVYDRVVLVSPSALLDATLSPFLNGEYYTPSSEKDLNEYVQIASNDPALRTLLIVDDCAAFIKRGDELCKLCTRYRHLNMSVIITAQYFMLLPPVIRTNTSICILFKIANDIELSKIIAEFKNSFGSRLEEAYNSVFSGSRKYNFLTLNFKDGIILDNFEKKIS